MKQVLRIFRQLVHIDDVRDGSKFMKCRQRTFPFQTAFQTEQERQRGTDKEQAPQRRFHRLGEVVQLTQFITAGMDVQPDQNQDPEDCNYQQNAGGS